MDRGQSIRDVPSGRPRAHHGQHLRHEISGRSSMADQRVETIGHIPRRRRVLFVAMTGHDRSVDIHRQPAIRIGRLPRCRTRRPGPLTRDRPRLTHAPDAPCRGVPGAATPWNHWPPRVRAAINALLARTGSRGRLSRQRRDQSPCFWRSRPSLRLWRPSYSETVTSGHINAVAREPV